jgi:hypothetical protein
MDFAVAGVYWKYKRFALNVQFFFGSYIIEMKMGFEEALG